eukprot:6943798-Pyramimonas_sp.AAC.1
MGWGGLDTSRSTRSSIRCGRRRDQAVCCGSRSLSPIWSNNNNKHALLESGVSSLRLSESTSLALPLPVTVCLSVCLSDCRLVSDCPTVRLSARLSVSLSVSLSVCLSVSQSVCLPACLSVVAGPLSGASFESTSDEALPLT